ncbi:MAG: hypothetical protein QOF75_28 [Gaiellaceae bacterium]|jgi:hypothetical protein|nr:hypothetical protein [Gaiellaceae bacterium]MDX6473936.1 hypothetical protein [Gaiellaceae bacterium]
MCMLACKEIANLRCLGMDVRAQPFYNYEWQISAHRG